MIPMINEMQNICLLNGQKPVKEENENYEHFQSMRSVEKWEVQAKEMTRTMAFWNYVLETVIFVFLLDKLI